MSVIPVAAASSSSSDIFKRRFDHARINVESDRFFKLNDHVAPAVADQTTMTGSGSPADSAAIGAHGAVQIRNFSNLPQGSGKRNTSHHSVSHMMMAAGNNTKTMAARVAASGNLHEAVNPQTSSSPIGATTTGPSSSEDLWQQVGRLAAKVSMQTAVVAKTAETSLLKLSLATAASRRTRRTKRQVLDDDDAAGGAMTATQLVSRRSSLHNISSDAATTTVERLKKRAEMKGTNHGERSSAGSSTNEDHGRCSPASGGEASGGRRDGMPDVDATSSSAHDHSQDATSSSSDPQALTTTCMAAAVDTATTVDSRSKKEVESLLRDAICSLQSCLALLRSADGPAESNQQQHDHGAAVDAKAATCDAMPITPLPRQPSGEMNGSSPPSTVTSCHHGAAASAAHGTTAAKGHSSPVSKLSSKLHATGTAEPTGLKAEGKEEPGTAAPHIANVSSHLRESSHDHHHQQEQQMVEANMAEQVVAAAFAKVRELVMSQVQISALQMHAAAAAAAAKQASPSHEQAEEAGSTAVFHPSKTTSAMPQQRGAKDDAGQPIQELVKISIPPRRGVIHPSPQSTLENHDALGSAKLSTREALRGLLAHLKASPRFAALSQATGGSAFARQQHQQQQQQQASTPSGTHPSPSGAQSPSFAPSSSAAHSFSFIRPLSPPSDSPRAIAVAADASAFSKPFLSSANSKAPPAAPSTLSKAHQNIGAASAAKLLSAVASRNGTDQERASVVKLEQPTLLKQATDCGLIPLQRKVSADRAVKETAELADVASVDMAVASSETKMTPVTSATNTPRPLKRGRSLDGSCVPLDGWEWRKYGQKPRQGHPYPRSYYRCSLSSQGCEAKKTAERCADDPDTWMVEYLGEHNHAKPVKRRVSRTITTSRVVASSSPIPVRREMRLPSSNSMGPCDSSKEEQEGADVYVAVPARESFVSHELATVDFLQMESPTESVCRRHGGNRVEDSRSSNNGALDELSATKLVIGSPGSQTEAEKGTKPVNSHLSLAAINARTSQMATPTKVVEALSSATTLVPTHGPSLQLSLSG